LHERHPARHTPARSARQWNADNQARQGEATNYKQCLALEVPGFVAFYKSKPDFAGVDSATI
jgi:hypothetical protein